MTVSTLFVPVRSNGRILLAGAPVAALRRRLKYASLFYDRILLEGGVLSLSAGPGGYISGISPANPADPPRWETAAARRRAQQQQQQQSFQVSMGRELTPGVMAPRMSTLLSSDTTLSWTATLEPFAWELPAAADWLEFVTVGSEEAEAKDLASRWTRADRRNAALEDAIPGQFVRDAIIKNVNRDLALAAASGFAATVDPLHVQVVAQRFSDDTGWKVQGYAVPIVIPQVGDLPWEAIVDLRSDRSMARFRAVLREVEAEVADEAAGAGLEGAVHRAFQRHLSGANEIEGLAAPVKRAAVGLIIGGSAGLVTYGMANPGGLATSTGLGTAAGLVLDARNVIRRRRSKGWIAVHQRILRAGA